MGTHNCCCGAVISQAHQPICSPRVKHQHPSAGLPSPLFNGVDLFVPSGPKFLGPNNSLADGEDDNVHLSRVPCITMIKQGAGSRGRSHSYSVRSISAEATKGSATATLPVPNIKSFISCSNSHTADFECCNSFNLPKIYCTCQRSVCLKRDNEIYVSAVV